MLRYDDPWWATLFGLTTTGLLGWAVVTYKAEILTYFGAL